MAISTNRSGSTGNFFLDSLPDTTAKRLRSELTLVPLKVGRVLSEPGVPADELYFPIRSLISTVMRMENGSAVEVGLAGRDGMSSMSLAFGSRVGPHTTVVQIADSAYVMRAETFVELFESDAALRSRSLKYAHYCFVAAAQFAACNTIHALEARYARWLLMAADRVGDGEFTLTQEYTAQMLGVRRAGVTMAAGAMSNAGLISYRRSHVTILDRPGMEESACECYRAINAELLRLLGYDARLGAGSNTELGYRPVAV